MISLINHKIKKIYSSYPVPKNLQRHMLMVAEVAKVIFDNWQGPFIDKEKLILAGLLHDIGNLAKFDFKQPWLKLPNKELSYWQQKQVKFWQKYGKDDHVASQRILKELSIDREIRNWIKQKTFSNIINLVAKNNFWPVKVLLYADLRVLPTGIGSLEDRIEDIKARMPHYVNRPDFNEMIKAAFLLETQIQSVTKINLKFLSNYLK